jgi:hypothetical protein
MNDPSTIFQPARQRVVRKRRGAQAPVATGPVLLAASYAPGDLILSLTFDRAVDVSAIVPGQLIVVDGEQDIEWGGTAEAWQDSPESLSMIMIENGEYTGEGTKLTVTSSSGIVAAEGGAAFAGVSDVELPYP